MGFELNILDWFQTLHTPVMDKLMTSVTKLGDAGIFWIILTLIFLIIPHTFLIFIFDFLPNLGKTYICIS